MKKKTKRILLPAAISVLCLACAYWFYSPEDVEIYRVSTGDMTEDLKVKGYLVPESVNVVSSVLPGAVIMAPSPGQTVSGEDTPILLDDKTAQKQLADQMEALKLQQTAMSSDSLQKQEQLSAQLAEAKMKYENLFLSGAAQAEKEAAQAAYTQAERDYSNGLTLRDGGYLSDQELRELYLKLMTTRHQLSVADSACSDSTRSYYEDLIRSYQLQLRNLKDETGGQVSAAQAGAAQLQITIDDMEKKLFDADRLSKDIRGTAYEVYVSPGQYVSAATPLFSVYQDEDILIRAQLLTNELNGIEEGMKVALQFADGTLGEGTVDFISTVAKEGISSIGLSESKCIVEISAPEIPGGNGPGFPVDLTFHKVLAKDTVSLPLSAIVPSEAGESCVYLLNGRKKILTPVSTGIKGGGRIQILSGIKEGDAVIADPLQK